MRLMEKVKHKLRTFLEIDNNQQNGIYLQNLTDYETECYINRVWSWGDKEAIEQLYKQLNLNTYRLNFWTATPAMGLLKRHTGIPGQIVRILTDIVIRDLNDITINSERKFEWEEMNKNDIIHEVTEEAVKEALIVGDGAFRISLNSSNKYPLVDFVSGENVEYKKVHGKINEIIFKSPVNHNHKKYVLEEAYGYGYIYAKLYDGDNEVPLDTIQSLSSIEPVSYEGKFMMAVPFIIFKSDRFKGRGASIFKGKQDNFDALDEIWSQWLNALRKGQSKEYIPTDLLPVNEETGEVMKPNDFDNVFIATEGSMGEGGVQKITLVQPDIPHESYLSTYVTALDLCLQGIISPSTLGIDTKKMDNAEAQREKEKTTLYTRNKIIEALQKTLPRLVDAMFKAYDTLNERQIMDIDVEVSFGEYANPSFESQVETVSKAKAGQIMSIEASVEELYGDTKEEEWKLEEIKRLKAEQGIEEVTEQSVAMEQTGSAIDTEIEKSINEHVSLNGAQIGSLMNMVSMVKSGQLTRTEAINIMVTTLNISRESAETFIENKL